MDIKRKKYLFFLIAVLAIAVFFRFWDLSSLPPGIYPDEAINANEAVTEGREIFYPENNGREGLFINLISLSFSLFGISVWSLKFISALIGVLTVFGVYLLTKEVFKFQNKEAIALLASFFMAVGFWHVNFSRIGFRAIMVPFCLTFLFYFLFRGIRNKKTINFVLAGFFFGLGFHTYIAYRVSVILILAVLIAWWLNYRKQNLQKRFFRLASCFLLFTFITALPVGIYFLKNPQDFSSRATGVSIFAAENIFGAGAKGLFAHLAMFNVWGDGNWRHNISDKPILFWPVGVLFLVGLTISIREIIRKILKKKSPIFHASCFLILWWLCMLLPGILTIEGIPHSLRVIGAVPPTFILASLGGYFLYFKIKNTFLSKPKSLTKIALIFFLFVLAGSFIFAQYFRYFWIWGKNPEVRGAFSADYVKLGEHLNSLPNSAKIYLIVNQGGVLVNGIPMPSQTVEFTERTKYKEPRAVYLTKENMSSIELNEEGETLIFLMAPEEEIFQKLINQFPNGKIKKVKDIRFFQII